MKNRRGWLLLAGCLFVAGSRGAVAARTGLFPGEQSNATVIFSNLQKKLKKGIQKQLGNALLGFLVNCTRGPNDEALSRLGMQRTKVKTSPEIVAFVPSWKKLSPEELAQSSPLKLKPFMERATTPEEKNSLSYVISKTMLSPWLGVKLSPETTQKRLKALYDRVALALEEHDAAELASGRIVAFKGGALKPMAHYPNGTIVADELVEGLADRFGKSLAKSLAGKAGQTSMASPELQALGRQYADDILLTMIAHDILHASRGAFMGTVPTTRVIKGYWSEKNGLTEQQKFELFCDLYGAELAIRAGARPEGVLAYGRMLDLLQSQKDGVSVAEIDITDHPAHPRGNDRYYFLYNWIMRMDRVHKKRYRKGAPPVDEGPYLSKEALRQAKEFPKPWRTVDAHLEDRLWNEIKALGINPMNVFMRASSMAIPTPSNETEHDPRFARESTWR